jgi:hypothetical protein
VLSNDLSTSEAICPLPRTWHMANDHTSKLGRTSSSKEYFRDSLSIFPSDLLSFLYLRPVASSPSLFQQNAHQNSDRTTSKTRQPSELTLQNTQLQTSDNTPRYLQVSKKQSNYRKTATTHQHSAYPHLKHQQNNMPFTIMSSLTDEHLSQDILESPIFQRYQQCLDEYYTWLLNHRAGEILTAQSALLSSATTTLYRLSRECEDSTYTIDEQGLQLSQRQQDVYELTQWCRNTAAYIDARIELTFIEFSAAQGVPLSRIQQAWDFANLSAEEITRFITKQGWADAAEARWRAELDWRFGRTHKRPPNVLMMPRRQVVVDELIGEFIVQSGGVVPSSSQSQSTSANAQQSRGLPDRTRKLSSS